MTWTPLIESLNMPPQGWVYSDPVPKGFTFFEVTNQLFNSPPQMWAAISQVEIIPSTPPLLFEQQRWRLRSSEKQLLELPAPACFTERRVALQIISAQEYSDNFRCNLSVKYWEENAEEVVPTPPYQAIVTDQETIVCPSNSFRKELCMFNSGLEKITLILGLGAKWGLGIPLSPMKAYSRDRRDWFYGGPVSAVCQEGKQSQLTIMESS